MTSITFRRPIPNSLRFNRMRWAGVALLGALAGIFLSGTKTWGESPETTHAIVELRQFQSQQDPTWGRVLEVDRVASQLEQGDEIEPQTLVDLSATLRNLELGIDKSQITDSIEAMEHWRDQLDLAYGDCQRARVRLSELDQWLDTDPRHADGWRDFLRTRQLAAQIEKGNTADLEVLRSIASKFNSPIDGLDRSRFVATQGALENWIRRLEQGEGQAPSSMAEERRAVAESTAAMQSWFTRDRARGAEWRKFLMWNDLTEQLGLDEPSVEVVDRITERFTALANIPDRPSLTHLRQALNGLRAEMARPVVTDLAKEARLAKHDYRPVSESEVRSTRDQLVRSTARLENFLGRSGPVKAEHWKVFLRWDELQTELNSPDAPNLNRLQAISRRMESGETGLNLPAFEAVTKNLRRYIQVLQLHEAGPDGLTRSRLAFQESIENLDRFLQSGGQATEEGWKRFLQWEQLQQLAEQADPEMAEMRRVDRIFSLDQAGLEHVRFQRVARTLRNFAERRALTRQTTAEDIVNAHLESLSLALDAYASEPASDTAAKVTKALSWLENTGQSPALVQRIREEFSHPNLLVYIPAPVITDGVRRPVQQTTPICRTMDRARITGTGVTSGMVTGQLVPSSQGVLLDVLLSSKTNIRTVANARPVYIHSGGVTNLTGRKRIQIDLDGITASPATARACSKTWISSAQPKRQCAQRLVKRMAMKRANKTVPKAERIASQEASRKARKQLDDEVGQMVSRANQRMQEKMREVRGKLTQLKLTPQALSLVSSSTAAFLNGRLSPAPHVATLGTPPTVRATSQEVVMRVHQSLFNNAAAQVVGGLKMTPERAVSMLKQYDMKVPDELRAEARAARLTRNMEAEGETNERLPLADASTEEKLGEDAQQAKDWSITFDQLRPFSVDFSDGLVKVTVRGTRFRRDEMVINNRAKISAVYDITRADKDWQLDRQGDIEIEFVGRDPGRSRLAFATGLRRRFEKIFPTTLSTATLIKDDPSLKWLRDVTVNQLDLQDGWLILKVSNLQNLKTGLLER